MIARLCAKAEENFFLLKMKKKNCFDLANSCGVHYLTKKQNNIFDTTFISDRYKITYFDDFFLKGWN